MRMDGSSARPRGDWHWMVRPHREVVSSDHVKMAAGSDLGDTSRALVGADPWDQGRRAQRLIRRCRRPPPVSSNRPAGSAAVRRHPRRGRSASLDGDGIESPRWTRTIVGWARRQRRGNPSGPPGARRSSSTDSRTIGSLEGVDEGGQKPRWRSANEHSHGFELGRLRSGQQGPILAQARVSLPDCVRHSPERLPSSGLRRRCRVRPSRAPPLTQWTGRPSQGLITADRGIRLLGITSAASTREDPSSNDVMPTSYTVEPARARRCSSQDYKADPLSQAPHCSA